MSLGLTTARIAYAFTLVSLLGLPAHAAQDSHFTLLTSAGTIGSLTVREDGRKTEVDWKVDDNGRGAKLKESIEVDKNGFPIRWSIQGVGDVGAPVRESLSVVGGKAKWESLDDRGEAPSEGKLYLPNHSSPWSSHIFFRNAWSARNHTRETLPGGSIRFEELRDVKIGKGKSLDNVKSYAVWGPDFTPQLILVRNNRFVGNISPGWVLIEDKYKDDFPNLSSLAGELSSELLKAFTKKITHSVDGPLWITNVRVYDSLTGKLGALSNIGIFRDRITFVGSDFPPDDATTIDGQGGTVLPGLFDSHAHLTDWNGPLDLASGVTFTRDPGNDNATRLLLQKRIEAGEFAGPRARLSGFIEGLSPFSAHVGYVISNIEEAKEKIRWYASHGYWGIKIYNSMNPDFVQAMAQEAHRLGLHVSGHVPAFMSSERAVRDGYDEINHINQLVLSFLIDPKKDDTRTPFRFTALGERAGTLDLKGKAIRDMIRLMKERKTTIDPTMSIFAGMLLGRPGQVSPADLPWLHHAPSAVQRGRRAAELDIKPEQYPIYAASWKRLEETLKLLHQEGIPLVPGTDDNAVGLALHSELETWVRAGISASDTLRAATLGGARFTGWENELGNIAPGKLADLYLVEGDPTQEIGQIRKGRLVVKGGAVYFPEEIHERLGVKPFAKRAQLIQPAKAH